MTVVSRDKEVVALVDDAAQVVGVEAMGLGKAVVWVALAPAAIEALGRRGSDFAIPEGFLPRPDVNAICEAAFAWVQRAADRVNEVAWRMDPLIRQAHISVGSVMLLDWAARADSIVKKVELLDRIEGRMEGASMIVFEKADTSLAKWSFGRVARMRGWRAGLSVLTAPGSRPPAGLRMREIAGRFARSHSFLWSLRETGPGRLLSGLTKCVLRHDKAVLVVKAPYEWRETLALVKCPVFFDDTATYGTNVPAELPGEAYDECKRAIISAFPGGRPFWLEPFAAELASEIGMVMANVRSAFARAKRIKRRLRIGAVLNAVSTDWKTQAVLAGYQAAGVTVMKWQHGAVWRNGRITQRAHIHDMLFADELLTFGPSVARAYLAEKAPSRCWVTSVGSARCDRLIARRRFTNPDRTVSRLLYVVTNYYLGNWYCGFYPCFSDTVYYRDQLRILRGLAGLLETHRPLRLTIKLQPNLGEDGRPPWVDRVANQPRIRCITEKPGFPDLIFDSDAIVVDSPTTTLLESLCSTAPVFVNLNTVGWPDDAVKLLRRRAVAESDADRLMEKLAAFIDSGAYGADRTDTAFLREFAIDQGDGRSAHRASVRIAEALAGPSPKSIRRVSCTAAGGETGA